jgi:hypothetical protein
MRPALPPAPSSDVDRIRPAWIKQLLKCVKYGMDTPRGDGVTTRRQGDAICARRRIGSGSGSGATKSYTGFFILQQSDEDPAVVQVVDGTELLPSGICGVYVAGLDRVLVADASLAISGDCFVVARATWDQTADPQWTVSIETADAFPTPSETEFVEVLGFVKWDFDNSTIADVVQIWNSGILYCNRYV